MCGCGNRAQEEAQGVSPTARLLADLGVPRSLGADGHWHWHVSQWGAFFQTDRRQLALAKFDFTTVLVNMVNANIAHGARLAWVQKRSVLIPETVEILVLRPGNSLTANPYDPVQYLGPKIGWKGYAWRPKPADEALYRLTKREWEARVGDFRKQIAVAWLGAAA